MKFLSNNFLSHFWPGALSSLNLTPLLHKLCCHYTVCSSCVAPVTLICTFMLGALANMLSLVFCFVLFFYSSLLFCFCWLTSWEPIKDSFLLFLISITTFSILLTLMTNLFWLLFNQINFYILKASKILQIVKLKRKYPQIVEWFHQGFI